MSTNKSTYNILKVPTIIPISFGAGYAICGIKCGTAAATTSVADILLMGSGLTESYYLTTITIGLIYGRKVADLLSSNEAMKEVFDGIRKHIDDTQKEATFHERVESFKSLLTNNMNNAGEGTGGAPGSPIGLSTDPVNAVGLIIANNINPLLCKDDASSVETLLKNYQKPVITSFVVGTALFINIKFNEFLDLTYEKLSNLLDYEHEPIYYDNTKAGYKVNDTPSEINDSNASPTDNHE